MRTAWLRRPCFRALYRVFEVSFGPVDRLALRRFAFTFRSDVDLLDLWFGAGTASSALSLLRPAPGLGPPRRLPFPEFPVASIVDHLPARFYLSWYGVAGMVI